MLSFDYSHDKFSIISTRNLQYMHNLLLNMSNLIILKYDFVIYFKSVDGNLYIEWLHMISDEG